MATIIPSLTKTREMKGYTSKKILCEVFTVAIGGHQVETMFTADNAYARDWLTGDHLRVAEAQAGEESVFVGLSTFRGIIDGGRWGVTTIVLYARHHCLVYAINGGSPVQELGQLFQRVDVVTVGLQTARDVGSVRSEWEIEMTNLVDLFAIVKTRFPDDLVTKKGMVSEEIKREVRLEDIASVVLSYADVAHDDQLEDRRPNVISMSPKLEKSNWMLIPGDKDVFEKLKLATVGVFLSSIIAEKYWG